MPVEKWPVSGNQADAARLAILPEATPVTTSRASVKPEAPRGARAELGDTGIATSPSFKASAASAEPVVHRHEATTG